MILFIPDVKIAYYNDNNEKAISAEEH